MRKSLKLLTSGTLGANLPSSLESSPGQELKSQPGSLKQRVISRLKGALAEVPGLSKAKRMAIVILITQALDTITEAEAIEMMTMIRDEFEAILLEFEGGQ